MAIGPLLARRPVLGRIHLREPRVARAPERHHHAGAASRTPANSAPPGRRRGTSDPRWLYKDLPAFCRVAATLKPTSDSDIKIEVWLPASGWNGKFQAVGQWRLGRSDQLSRHGAKRSHDGYATSSTDTGHVGATGSFALGHPEKLIDFGYRAVHEMTVKAKSIIARLLWRRAPNVLLEWMFHRRPARAEGSAAISRRLRWHHRRRRGQPPNPSLLLADLARAGRSKIRPTIFPPANIPSFTKPCSKPATPPTG